MTDNRQAETHPKVKRPKLHVPKRLRNVLISAVILLILLVAAGVLYTLLTDQSANDITPEASSAAATPEPIQPPKVAANAQESAAIEILTSPITPGTNASMTVQTNPGSKCSLDIKYKGTAAKDTVLQPQTADDYGNVSWSWTISRNTPLGTWPVNVTCVYHGRSAVVIGDLQVTS